MSIQAPDTYHKMAFTSCEGCQVRLVSHSLVSVDQVEAIADDSTLLQAIGPVNSTLLQLHENTILQRDHAMQFWLQPHEEGQHSVGEVTRSVSRQSTAECLCTMNATYKWILGRCRGFQGSRPVLSLTGDLQRCAYRRVLMHLDDLSHADCSSSMHKHRLDLLFSL